MGEHEDEPGKSGGVQVFFIVWAGQLVSLAGLELTSFVLGDVRLYTDALGGAVHADPARRGAAARRVLAGGGGGSGPLGPARGDAGKRHAGGGGLFAPMEGRQM